MKVKKQRILGQMIAFACISTTMISAANIKTNVTTMGVKPEVAKIASISTSYHTMSTKDLEKEVERLTVNGNVPFEMGVELMKRWTKG